MSKIHKSPHTRSIVARSRNGFFIVLFLKIAFSCSKDNDEDDSMLFTIGNGLDLYFVCVQNYGNETLVCTNEVLQHIYIYSVSISVGEFKFIFF